MLHFFKKKNRLVPYVDKTIKGAKDGRILTPGGDKYKRSSIRGWENTAMWLRQVEQEKGSLYVEDIDREWAEELILFLQDHGLSKNTIGANIARLKAILRRLWLEGLIDFNGSGIRAGSELTTSVYNTLDELELLYKLDIPNSGMARVRDVYIVQCFLGLRYSDLREVLRRPERYFRTISGRDYFEIATQKTGETVVIPISNIVRSIFEERGVDAFGEMFSYQFYNRSIKELAELAGINSGIVHTRTQGGKRVDTLIPKSALMSSHTARRTFATNAYLSDVPVLAIMSITGHRLQSSFMRYIRCSATESAIRIADHPFFQDAFKIRLHNRSGQ